MVSRLATHGSYLARDSGTVLHLCQVGSYKWEDTVRAIHPAAVVWPGHTTPPSVPGVEVVPVDIGSFPGSLRVGNSWKAAVRGLQDAESRGHKTVAVKGWGGFATLFFSNHTAAPSIRVLSNPIAVRRDPAATDVWLLEHDTDELSRWQREMDEDSRYRRIK